ncbi:MAG: GTP-sensing pleiotropic transcriptional regulator CodY [Eubacteriales bacterium]
MNKYLLQKMRKLNWLLQESQMGAFSFKEICEWLGNIMLAIVYVFDENGYVLGSNDNDTNPPVLVWDEKTSRYKAPFNANEELLGFEESAINISKDELQGRIGIGKNSQLSDGVYMIIPIFGGGRRLGTLLTFRKEIEYDTEDVILGEASSTIIGLEILRIRTARNEEEERLKNTVQLSIGTLSYSEIEAVKRIFENLEGEEGLLIASKIADKAGITRSVIVNALRKLQSAGLIETRSLGMKGTHIRILNPKFTEELDKLRM